MKQMMASETTETMTPAVNREPLDIDIAILGGGITGLTSAFYLLKAGARVTLYEAQPQLGGLATYFNFGSFWWDKYYHCILTSDEPLLGLIDDLGLTSKLRWTPTKVGFFADEKLYSMSSSLDFLLFRPLSLLQKARLAAGILYTCRIKDGRSLEAELATTWLTKVFGQKNYQKMWGPLLKCKLGACREQASAAFIWATITRLYSTRDKSSSQQERLGYVQGGYRTVFNRLVEAVREMGGVMVTDAPAKRISGASLSGTSSGISLNSPGNGKVELEVKGERHYFDKVISTIPNRPFAAITPELDAEYVRKLNSVTYLGIVCIALVLKRRLSPFYVTNLASEDVPFTGIIEMTNLISTEETSGRHLVYLPKYIAPGDPLFEASDDAIWAEFRRHVLRVVPDFKDSDIEQRFTFRERYVQPVPTLHYSDIVPEMETGVDGVILANTTQIINSTLNNNAMVKIARQAVEAALKPSTSVSVSKSVSKYAANEVATVT
jgi:protoporphyrinogen oxidase